MEILEYDKRRIRRIPRIVSIEAMVGVLALVAAVVMVWIAVTSSDNVSVMVVAGILFTACVVVVIFLLLNPDTVRAQADRLGAAPVKPDPRPDVAGAPAAG